MRSSPFRNALAAAALAGVALGGPAALAEPEGPQGPPRPPRPPRSAPAPPPAADQIDLAALAVKTRRMSPNPPEDEVILLRHADALAMALPWNHPDNARDATAPSEGDATQAAEDSNAAAAPCPPSLRWWENRGMMQASVHSYGELAEAASELHGERVCVYHVSGWHPDPPPFRGRRLESEDGTLTADLVRRADWGRG